MTTPTTEPTEIRAGDLWKWRREDLTADYPASTWTLTYRFKNAAGGFEVVADADGDDFEATVAAATSAAIADGEYHWQARVSSGAEVYTIGTGVANVLPNLFATSAATASDQRTHARKVLVAIQAVLEGRATKDQEEYTIANRSLKRTPLADLVMLMDRYRLMVAREDQAAGIGNALGSKAYVRFGRA